MRTLDSNGNEVQNPDMTLGSMNMETIVTKHHDAVEAVKEIGHYETVAEYDNGGKVQEWIIDTPGVEAKDAYDETEQIMRYIPYTAEQLAENEFLSKKAQLSDALQDQLVRVIPTLLKNIVIDPELAVSVSMLLPAWNSTESYNKGITVRYGDDLYTSNEKVAMSDQTPDKDTTLWKKVVPKDSDGKDVWIQPISAASGYSKDAVVSYGQTLWVSQVDGNIWTPGTDLTKWMEAGPKGGDVNDYIPVTKSREPYSEGQTVFVGDKSYISKANDNVWDPGVTQWSEVNGGK